MQLALFEELVAPVTVASPICVYERRPCHRRGRAILGPEVVLDGCVNRSIVCVTCGAHGEESRNTEPRKRSARS